MGLEVNRETKAELTTAKGQRVLCTALEGSNVVRLAVPAHNYAELSPWEMRALAEWLTGEADAMAERVASRVAAARKRETDAYDRLSGGVRGWTAAEAEAQRKAMESRSPWSL